MEKKCSWGGGRICKGLYPDFVVSLQYGPIDLHCDCKYTCFFTLINIQTLFWSYLAPTLCLQECAQEDSYDSIRDQLPWLLTCTGQGKPMREGGGFVGREKEGKGNNEA